MAEVLGELGAEDVGARGEKLAQLHRHRTQLLKSLGQALAGTPLPGCAASEEAQGAGRKSGRRGEEGIDLPRR